MLDVFCCFLTEDQRLVKKKSVCSGDNSEVPYTLKREELFARTTSLILRNPNLIISSLYMDILSMQRNLLFQIISLITS